jgi:hypothetical protein
MLAERRTMTITRAEFQRSLQPLKQHYQVEVDERATEVEITRRSFKVVIQLRDNNPIVLGSLKMPSLEVIFNFEGSATDQIAQFWMRFDLCFRRGGG